MAVTLPGLFCTTVERLTRVARDEVTRAGGHIEGTARKANVAAGSVEQAAARGEEAVKQATDTVLYGRLSDDFSRWVSFSPDDVWVEPLDRGDGTRFGYLWPTTQQDVDIAKVTSPIMDFSGVAEVHEHPTDFAKSHFRGPFPPPWSAEPTNLRAHAVLGGQSIWLNVDSGAGTGRSLLVVDGSTAARVAESRGLLGAGAGGSELYLDMCDSGVVGGAAESFVSQLRKPGPFSGKVIAPTDLDAHVHLTGEDSARIGVGANYDENGEMLPPFREFEVDKQAAVE